MRRWRFVTPGENDEPIETVVSEEEILRDYFPWWSAQMRKARKEDLISAEHCIDDYVVVNWAERIE